MPSIANQTMNKSFISTIVLIALSFNVPSTTHAFDVMSSQLSSFFSSRTHVRNTLPLQMIFNIGKTTASIPSSPADRDQKAISAIRAAVENPRDPAFPLIECEFPALEALNKLGDGSLRSAREAEKSNLTFTANLLKSLAPIPFLGPRTWLLLSASASQSFLNDASRISGTTLHSLKDGLPSVTKDDVCVLVTPSSKKDYDAAQNIAKKAKAVIIVNGFAKDTRSVPGQATMAYFLKPLTYNSQVAGYLIRNYPSPWTTFDAVSKEVLSTLSDKEILVQNTNTPDLRQSGKLVQKSVDERAIRSRNGTNK